MTASPFRHFLAILAWSIGLLSALIGSVFLLSGLQAYIGTDLTEASPFAQLLFAVGFLGLPMGLLLLHRARASFLRGFEKYSLPDPPLRSMTMSVAGTAFVIAAITAFIIANVLF
jgi:hypothetical protein